MTPPVRDRPGTTGTPPDPVPPGPSSGPLDEPPGPISRRPRSRRSLSRPVPSLVAHSPRDPQGRPVTGDSKTGLGRRPGRTGVPRGLTSGPGGSPTTPAGPPSPPPNTQPYRPSPTRPDHRLSSTAVLHGPHCGSGKPHQSGNATGSRREAPYRSTTLQDRGSGGDGERPTGGTRRKKWRDPESQKKPYLCLGVEHPDSPRSRVEGRTLRKGKGTRHLHLLSNPGVTRESRPTHTGVGTRF